MSDPVIVQLTESDGVDRYAVQDALREGKSRLRDVPVRWRDAVVTVPEVAEWVRTLVGLSVKETGDPRVRRGPSLLLTGPVGVGKTFNAWGSVRALCVSGAVCQWQAMKAVELFAMMRPRPGVDSEEEFHDVARAGLLVLDDLGACRGNESREETLCRLIDHRYDHELPMLVTTNVGQRPGDTISAAVGDRVASRLAEMCAAVALTGPDRRRQGGAR